MAPCFLRTSLAKSQYTVARALRPRLFAGITKSTFEVILSLLAMAITAYSALSGFNYSLLVCLRIGYNNDFRLHIVWKRRVGKRARHEAAQN